MPSGGTHEVALVARQPPHGRAARAVDGPAREAARRHRSAASARSSSGSRRRGALGRVRVSVTTRDPRARGRRGSLCSSQSRCTARERRSATPPAVSSVTARPTSQRRARRPRRSQRGAAAAAQTDRAPNGVAGNPVHWVYAIPSDGADNLAALASVMQADAEQIDVWWRGQDPARTPRNDIASFSCGAQLDITTVRIVAYGRRALAAPGPLLRRSSTRSTQPGSARRSRSTSSTSTARPPTRTSAARAEATRTDSGSRSSTTARAPACRRPPSPRTRCSTRSARSRAARRTSARARRAGTRATTRRDLMFPVDRRRPALGEAPRPRTRRLLRPPGRLDGHAGLAVARAARRARRRSRSRSPGRAP